MSLLTNCLACHILANHERLSYGKKSERLQLIRKEYIQKQATPPTSLSFIKTIEESKSNPEKFKLKKIA